MSGAADLEAGMNVQIDVISDSDDCDSAEAEIATLRARLAESEARVRALEPVVAWIVEHHVKQHDSDVVDVDHGPIVEWDYCEWCNDHGLPEDWPCMFIKAAAAAALRGAEGREGE